MLLSGGFHADLRDIHPQCGGDILPHGIPVGRDLGSLRDQRGVDIHHSVALLPEMLSYPFQQQHTGNVVKRRVVIREQLADIPGGDRAQQRIHNGVRQHVGIGMAVQPTLPRDGHAA